MLSDLGMGGPMGADPLAGWPPRCRPRWGLSLRVADWVAAARLMLSPEPLRRWPVWLPSWASKSAVRNPTPASSRKDKDDELDEDEGKDDHDHAPEPVPGETPPSTAPHRALRPSRCPRARPGGRPTGGTGPAPTAADGNHAAGRLDRQCTHARAGPGRQGPPRRQATRGGLPRTAPRAAPPALR